MIGQGATFGRRLRALRLARGLKQAEVARLIGRHQTTIGPYERDEYTPSADIVERLARVLDSSAEYLVFGRHPRRSVIPLAGRIVAGGIAETVDLGTVALRDDQVAGWRMLDDSMLPAYRVGQIVLVMTAAEQRIEDLLGCDALVELVDGRRLLRRLLPAARSEVFDLAAWNGPTLTGASLLSVRRVVGTAAAEAFMTSPDIA